MKATVLCRDSKYIVTQGSPLDFDSILPNYMFGIMLLRSSFVKTEGNTDLQDC